MVCLRVAAIDEDISVFRNLRDKPGKILRNRQATLWLLRYRQETKKHRLCPTYDRRFQRSLRNVDLPLGGRLRIG